MGLASSAIGLGTSLIAGRRAGRASESAEDAQVQAQLAAAQTQREGQVGGVNALRAARGAATGNIRRGRNIGREDLQPFTEFGTGQIGALEDILTSEGQLDFLEGNPIFQAALRNANLGTRSWPSS